MYLKHPNMFNLIAENMLNYIDSDDGFNKTSISPPPPCSSTS